MSRKRDRRSAAFGLARLVAVLETTAAVMVFGGGLPAGTAAQAVADSAAIGARVEAYLRAWNAHDPSALATFFTEGADFAMGNQPAAHGRQEIRDSWQAYFARQEPERHLTLDVRPLRFVTADVAVMYVGTTTGGRDRQGQALPTRRFRGAWVWHRQGDSWLIAAMRGLPTERDRVVLNESLEAAEDLRPQIRALVHAYEDAFNAHDPSAVSALYTDDAEMVIRNLPPTRGREAIQQMGQTYFAEPRPYPAILIVDDIRMIAPEVALINIIATGAGPQSDGRPLPARYARATWVVVREAGEWRISALWVLPSEDDRIDRDIGRSN